MSKTKPVPSSSTHPDTPFDERNDPEDLPPPYEPSGPSQQTGPHNYQPQGHSLHHGGYPGANYHANAHHQQAPFPYPAGYFCPACRNTGIKVHNGHACGQCERLFGRQGANVMYAPMMHHAPPGVTYLAGDPRIGGRVCGNCKGRGIRSSMFGMVEEQCYVCRGIGRIL